MDESEVETEPALIKKPALKYSFHPIVVLGQAARMAGEFAAANTGRSRLTKIALGIGAVIGGGIAIATLVPGILAAAIVGASLYTGVAVEARVQLNKDYSIYLKEYAAYHEAIRTEAAEKAATATGVATSAKDVTTASPGAPREPLSPPDSARPIKGRGLSPAELHRVRSDIAKARFWRLQTEQAVHHREQFECISAAATPREARRLAAAALLVRGSDAVRCRENLAYRSALEQIVKTAKDGRSLERVKTFASDVLSIYHNDVSVATTKAAPTPEQNARVAARAADVGSTMTKRITPIARIPAATTRATTTTEVAI